MYCMLCMETVYWLNCQRTCMLNISEEQTQGWGAVAQLVECLLTYHAQHCLTRTGGPFRLQEVKMGGLEAQGHLHYRKPSCNEVPHGFCFVFKDCS